MDDDFDFLDGFDVDAFIQTQQSPQPPPNDKKRHTAAPAFVPTSPASSKVKVKPSSFYASPAKTKAENDRVYRAPLKTRPPPPAQPQPSSTPAARAASHVPEPPAVAGEDVVATLRERFGHGAFRPGQADVVGAVLEGRDVAVYWATGMGKSICYQVPALHTGKTALVISPLVSLMRDQVKKLNSTTSGGKMATFLGSAQEDSSEEAKALRGDYLLVYATPEKATHESFLDRLADLHRCKGLSLIAVDEAHCVSEWGHDFRPAYRQLGGLRGHPGLRDVPIMALTATAVPRVRNDIATILGMPSPVVHLRSFDRENLQINVCARPTPLEALAPLVRSLLAKPRDNSTIIYAKTQKLTESLAACLQGELRANESEVQVAVYHAGRSNADRNTAHTDFLTGRAQVVVATVAFGMGIDKTDTRRVIHYHPPKTFEEYYHQYYHHHYHHHYHYHHPPWTGRRNNDDRVGSVFKFDKILQEALAAGEDAVLVHSLTVNHPMYMVVELAEIGQLLGATMGCFYAYRLDCEACEMDNLLWLVQVNSILFFMALSYILIVLVLQLLTLYIKLVPSRSIFLIKWAEKVDDKKLGPPVLTTILSALLELDKEHIRELVDNHYKRDLAFLKERQDQLARRMTHLDSCIESRRQKAEVINKFAGQGLQKIEQRAMSNLENTLRARGPTNSSTSTADV